MNVFRFSLKEVFGKQQFKLITQRWILGKHIVRMEVDVTGSGSCPLDVPHLRIPSPES
jgi:hypothetical protein